MTTWQKLNSALALLVFGGQALLGLVAACWLVVHPVPWVLMCPVPLLAWMCRPRHPVGGVSLRRVCGWAAGMVAVLLLQVPLTKAFLATTPLYEVVAGVLIVVSELVRVAAVTEVATEPAVGTQPTFVDADNLRSHP